MSYQTPNLTKIDCSHKAHSHDDLPNNEQLLSCEICLRSIPLSESEISEVEDYVVYFCGLECYDIWRKQKTNR